jgi:hypothetical protein
MVVPRVLPGIFVVEAYGSLAGEVALNRRIATDRDTFVKAAVNSR